MTNITYGNQVLFEDYVQQICEYHHAAGMAVTLVNGAGDTLYEHFRGYRDVERQLPMDDRTVFGLASVSKSFVALSVMQLQEKGLLSVEDPVSRYLPEFTNRNQAPVLLRHLLSHSAGFYPVPRTLLSRMAADMGLTEEKDGDFSLNAGLNQRAVETVCRQLDELTPEKGLISSPGNYISYCNDGFGLLSEIVRRVSGEQHFADYVKKNILDPLGMSRSSGEYLRSRQQENVSLLYQYKEEKLIGSTDSYDFAFALPGAGAMKSCLSDMRRYAAMYLREGLGPDGGRLLSGEGIRSMFRPRIELHTGGYYCFGLETFMLDNLKIIRHGGSQPGVSSHLFLAPEADTAALVLCNTSNVPVGLIAAAAMRMSQGRNPIPDRELGPEHPWSQETLEAVRGIYASEEGTSAAVEFRIEDHHPVLLQNGEPVNFIMTGRNTGVIRKRFLDSRIRIFRNDRGEVFAVSSGDRMLPRADASARKTRLFF